jgi:hypothetical protein
MAEQEMFASITIVNAKMDLVSLVFIGIFFIGGFVGEFSRQQTKLVIKTFRKIGRCIKSYQVGYLTYLVFAGIKQFRCFFQPDELNIVIRRHPRYSFYFFMKTGAAYGHTVRYRVNQIPRFGKIGHNDVVHLGNEFEVGGVPGYALRRVNGEEVNISLS